MVGRSRGGHGGCGVAERAAVGLGSNLGDRLAHLVEARRGLARLLDDMECSEVYETEPVGIESDSPFLNMCCVGMTSLGPEELLTRLQEAEMAAGRPPVGGADRGGDRQLDLDLLLYGERTVETDALSVPHPRLTERVFVLVPLAEVAGDWPVPGTGGTVAELASRVERRGIRRVGPLDRGMGARDDD